MKASAILAAAVQVALAINGALMLYRISAHNMITQATSIVSPDVVPILWLTFTLSLAGIGIIAAIQARPT